MALSTTVSASEPLAKSLDPGKVVPFLPVLHAICTKQDAKGQLQVYILLLCPHKKPHQHVPVGLKFQESRKEFAEEP